MGSGEGPKAPKPRAPARAKGKTTKGGSGDRGRAASRKAPAGRVTTADLASQLSALAAAVERVEASLAPRPRAADVAAEEHALLNLLDAIVDRRTEALLLPVARLAARLDRAEATEDDSERRRLLAEGREELDAVLDGLGLERIAPRRGDPLEPLLHEEVEPVREADLEEGAVAGLLRGGYRVRGGRLLLPALVTVNRWEDE